MEIGKKAKQERKGRGILEGEGSKYTCHRNFTFLTTVEGPNQLKEAEAAK